jgi:hypothetical protein
MEVIAIESKAFEQLKLEIKQYVKEALKELLEEKNLDDNKEWITIEEAMKLLPYKSKTTWQKLRDSGTIEISQAPGSRNILYSKKSIQNYLNKNRMKF